jgi:hypothetical protein
VAITVKNRKPLFPESIQFRRKAFRKTQESAENQSSDKCYLLSSFGSPGTRVIGLSYVVQGRTQFAPTEGLYRIVGVQGLRPKVAILTTDTINPKEPYCLVANFPIQFLFTLSLD